MKWHQTALTVSVSGLLAVAVVSVAVGAPSATKQRIAIEGRFNVTTGKSAWTLIPLSKGELSSDAGRGTGTGNAKPAVIRNGQSVTPLVGGDTLSGKRGTIALKENVRSHPAGLSYSADIGTWSFSGRDGVYAGYTGGGGFAAVGTPKGIVIFRMEGYVSKR
ncbi:MAG: hypothetical protein ACRDOF_04990 [Gaiellaceae bacterium]